MIDFKEHTEYGYKARTIENVLSSDATLAFFLDEFSPGELLTKRICKENNKPYLGINVSTGRDIDVYEEDFKDRVGDITNFLKGVELLNVAGNSLSTLKKYGVEDQRQVDFSILMYLKQTTESLKRQGEFKLKFIRSGMQSGVDEAALKAAESLGISAFGLSPFGWMFRNGEGVDISDEKASKARFQPKKPSTTNADLR